MSLALVPQLHAVPIFCADADHGPGQGPPLGTLYVAGPYDPAATHGYLCEPCTGRWDQRRAQWAHDNPGQPIPDWHLLTLTNPPAPGLVNP